MAKPTNKVRVMVEEASGCCASEVNAVATARPSAKAGPRHPKLVVSAGDGDGGHGNEGHAIHKVSLG